MLLENPEFREFWGKVVSGINQFKMTGLVLEQVYRVKDRVGNADELNKQAAIDMWRIEGALELWDWLQTLVEPKKDGEEDGSDYTGNL